VALTSVPGNGSTIQFGAFEVDLRSGELRNRGVKISVQDQPFKVLVILLESPGEVVTRDELQKRIWPDEGFGDFDHAVNVAIGKLRTALGDSANSPRYIETIPRRGYRFIEPLKQENRPGWWSWKVAARVLGLASLITGLLVGLEYCPSQRHSSLTETDTIVLGDFANSTGDAVFDDALKAAVNVSLRQSPFLNVLSESEVAKALRLMTAPADSKLTPKITREVCQRAGSKAYVAGSIGSLGDDYLLGLKAVNCQTGDTLAHVQVTATSKEKVVEALGTAASKLRGELGESLATVQKYDTPLSQATTPSIEALQTYSAAGKTWRSHGDAEAVPLFNHALELDPTFAVGYADLGTAHCNLGETALCAEYVTKAYQLRQRVTEKERFYIDSNYYMYGTGELEKAADVFREWKQVYPRDLNPYIDYGLIASNLGWLDAALSSDLEAFRLSKDSLVVYRNLSFDYLSLNRLDEAGAVLDQARAHKMDAPLLPNSYQLDFLRNDAKEMERCLSVASGKPAIESAILASHADTQAYQGHLKEAREFSRRAVAAALIADEKEDAAGWQVTEALREAEFGNSDQARQGAKAALALSTSKNVQVAAALAFARAGDSARAKTLVADLQKRFPTDTLLANYWLPCIKAAIALSQRDAAQAIADLQVASAYELGGGVPPFSSGATLYPAYLRGQAYLEAKRWQAATSEFRNMLDHRGLVWNFPLGALAYLQLGRTYAGSGDQADALISYQAFLTLWHDSDADVPVLRKAKAEYARVK
jgi:eukaryotic-like serine/threonine-protein kinase